MSPRFLVAFCSALISTYAASASFDCSKASSMVEIAICADDTLNSLDVELAGIYARAVAIDPIHKQAQRDWLKKRNSCTDNNCIRKAYEDRVSELNALRRAESTQPSSEVASHQPTASLQSSSAQVETVSESATQSTPTFSAPSSTAPTSKVGPHLVANTGPNEPGLAEALDKWFRSNFVLIAGVALLALVYATYGYAKGCPSCRKWYAAKKVSSELLGRDVEHRTVTRNDEHRDREGKLIKTVERKEQIQVTVSTHRNRYQCKYCGHEWSSVTTSESS